ncbi:MAG TPA: hypothetical protein VGL22_14650 [Terracidiphilus sp.]|jgi:hypothetical protein
MLLLSNPAFKAKAVYSEVGTLQVAPTTWRRWDWTRGSWMEFGGRGTPSLPAVRFNY